MEIEHFTTQKLFILVSTIMSWAKSKPPDPEDPEIAFTDEDYRRRRAHPNFTDHINAEKLILKLGKTNKHKFSTYIIASGHQYGAGEGVLHYFFKRGWLSETPAVPIFGDGSNFIPTIHVLDLAAVLQNVADHRPKSRYILAVDGSVHTLEELVKCISKNVGTGRTEKIPTEDAFLSKGLTQMHLDMLLVNLRMESGLVKESFNIKWVAQEGLVENIEQIVKEYKQRRGLLSLKIFIHGPPGVGKSTIAEELCKHYKLHHIKSKDVISEAIANLEEIVAPKELDTDNVGEEGEGHDGEEEERGENVEEAQELLDAIEENMEQNAGQLDDEYITKFMKDKLKSMPCRNQGYVLDGFPETYEQANGLFNLESEDEQGAKSKIPKYDTLITPDVAKLEDPENRFIVKEIIKEIGEPRNYGLTDEEKAELERQAAEERLVKEAQEKAEQERKEAEERAERMANWEEWNKHLEEVKRQEQELLEAQSVPLRNYLMRNVMPMLMQGINECCRIRPDDPVDFLAEYLFKNSPDI
ncbi:adenylate kinase 7 isoform X2 [Lathamus discolor]